MLITARQHEYDFIFSGEADGRALWNTIQMR